MSAAEKQTSSIEPNHLRFDGADLAVVEIAGEGYVSLPSLLAPFGKRVDKTMALLTGWARTKTERLAHTPVGGVRNSSSETTLLHIEDAPLLIARLSTKGMKGPVKVKHTFYLQRCSKALTEVFIKKTSPFASKTLDADHRELWCIGDSPEERAELQAAFRRVQVVRSYSTQRQHGWAKVHHGGVGGVLSVYRILSRRKDALLADLRAMEEFRLDIDGAEVRALPRPAKRPRRKTPAEQLPLFTVH